MRSAECGVIRISNAFRILQSAICNLQFSPPDLLRPTERLESVEIGMVTETGEIDAALQNRPPKRLALLDLIGFPVDCDVDLLQPTSPRVADGGRWTGDNTRQWRALMHRLTDRAVVLDGVPELLLHRRHNIVVVIGFDGEHTDRASRYAVMRWTGVALVGVDGDEVLS